MKLYTLKEDFVYTGGGIWVLFAEITSPDKKEKLYASVSDDSCFYYTSEEDCLNCENDFCGGCFDDPKTAVLPYKNISKALLRRFKRLHEEHRYD